MTYTPTSTGKEAKQYHHPDRVGTQLVTTGASSSFRQTTFPFGTMSAETTGNSNQVFTLYDRSSTTGLDYAVNRTYSKGQGRFTQVDPIAMASASIGNPQSNNLYAYVQNMPTDFVDPRGLNAIPFIYPSNCRVVGEARDGSAIYACGWNIHWMYIGGSGGGDFGGGGGPGGSLQSNTCGVNPLTALPGFSRNPTGVLGNLRPGVRGQGYFGAPRPANNPPIHAGIDISGISGSSLVFSFYPGTVASISGNASDTQGLGLTVTVNHGNGFTSSYSHLSSITPGLTVGSIVGVFAANPWDMIVEAIGVVGQSGNAAGQPPTEAHTHFAIKKNGVVQNPETFLNSPCPQWLPQRPKPRWFHR